MLFPVTYVVVFRRSGVSN